MYSVLSVTGPAVLCCTIATLLCILAFIPTCVGANPTGSISDWIPSTGRGYAVAVANASAFGIVLCPRICDLTHYCIKRTGHTSFCKRELRNALPEEQHSEPATPKTALLVNGKRLSLSSLKTTYQIAWSEGKAIFKLPCCVCGKLAKNRMWHAVGISSGDCASVQSEEFGSNLEICYGHRFEVVTGAGPRIINAPMTWPLAYKTCPPPCMEMLVCCHKCFHALPPPPEKPDVQASK